MSTTDLPRVDAKKGWSTNCRAGNHSTCQTIGAVCSCTCHDNGKTAQKGTLGPGRPRKAQSPEAAPRKRSAPVVEFVWEEPPEHSRLRSQPLFVKLAEPLLELQASPGKWARLVEYAAGASAGAGRMALIKHLGEKEWEFRAVRMPEGGSRLYGRYTGTAKEEGGK